MLGFFYLFRLLSRFFAANTVHLTMISIALGTNIFYYTSFTNPISHCYEFALILMFLWYSLRWFETPQPKILYLMGFLLGLIVLIRPLNLIVVIIPSLFQVDQQNFVIRQWLLVKKHFLQILIAGVCMFLVILPQLIYWKLNSGNWVFNSYVGEQFFWSRPMLTEFLFSYRKGWLLYTPMMALMLFGFVIQKKTLNQILPQILILLLVMIWVNSCWWCWWFGGTFGCRVLVDFYGLFAFPLAVVIEYCLSRHFMSRLTFTIFLAFIIFVNLFQTRQKLEGQIHWDSMTKDAYWQVFLKRRFPENYDSLLKTPDYEAAKNGKVVR
ncbi:MAG: glycosyltransferase family 39 protein [Saprospiraceae bacterium]|nr:glycosyltransferase family 39 protein [Candidatus Vicinibacter affinis]MBK6573145.1 glycosyltransferase family 39 protein [Candidatus Vicinibacter affinis]MBK7692964.1 glycosyltransferase family 39 protein [Candidatus Vicinibacter affinis]